MSISKNRKFKGENHLKELKENKNLQSVEGLTKREFEILLQISHGMSNKEIGASLDITERTVKNHASSLFRKIGVADRTQAALFAVKNGLVSMEDI